MTQEVPAHHARASLEIEGRPYDVIEVEGEESLNLGFYLQAVLLAMPYEGAEAFLGRRFALRMQGRDGDARRIVGVVTEVIEDLAPGERKRITLALMPRFRHLELTTGPVLWIGLDFKGLVRALLHEAGVGGVRVDFEFQSAHPVRPWRLRGVGESSQGMLARQLAREGIFCWVDSLEGEERLIFSDHNANCSYVKRGALRPVPELGMEASADGHPQVGIYSLESHDRLQPGAAIAYALPPEGPARPLASEPRAGDRPGQVSGFGVGAASLDEAERWARLRDEYHDQQTHQLLIRANRVDLAPGHCLTLESAGHSGDYLITRVRHRTAQVAGPLARGANLPYTCEAWLTPRARPYRSPMPPKREQPDIIEARLVSNSPYASLDEAGRYKVRTLFEPGLYPFGRGQRHEPEPLLDGLRRLTPHAGPRDPFGQPTGFHAPGLDDAPVLLACLDDDPDRLCVLGGYYDPRHRSPVTWDNPTENLYRTVSGNTLLMDDRKARELVRLFLSKGLIHLELNAKKAAHWAGLVTEEGAIEQSAGKTMAFKSGGDHIEQIDNDRVQQVENRSVTKTHQGKIHHQAGSDIQLAAGEAIRIPAGQDVEITAGGDFRLSAEQDATFQVRYGDHLIKVDRGEVFIQAAKDIWLEGDGSGPITLAQCNGGLEIDTQGNMTFFGNAFNVDFEKIILNGEVNYEVPGGAPAPKISTRPPLEPLPIEDLVDPREPVEKRVEEETVALVPVRYAIDKKIEGEEVYAYSAPSLARDLPALEQAKYVLRRPRTGWLYLLLQGKLYEFELDENASLIPDIETEPALEAAKARAENQALLLPKAAGTVWLAYSEHPWTEKQKGAMEAGSKRHQQMQRFALDGPGEDAFELNEIMEQVADYGGPGGDFSWSDTPGSIDYDLTGLQAELLNHAEAGQQVVALHDPIGISHDLAARVEEGLETLASYIAEPDDSADQVTRERYRKRIIAETIESLYRSYQEQHPQQTKRRGPHHPQGAAQRYAKHVKEEERKAFLERYRADLANHQEQLDRHRLDRLAYLNTWRLTDRPSQLGAAWDTFDLDDEADWHHFEHSFARSQASLLGMAPNRQEDQPDRVLQKERALLTQWLNARETDSPIDRAIAGHPPLREAVAQYRAQRQRDAQADTPQTNTETAETAVPINQASETKNASPGLFGLAYVTAADRSGSISEAAADLLEKIHQRFPRTIGTETIVQTLTAYTLSAEAGFTPSVQNAMHGIFKRQGLDRLIPEFEGRFRQYVVITEETLSDGTKWYNLETQSLPPASELRTTDAFEGDPHTEKQTTYSRTETRIERKSLFGKGVLKPLRGRGTAIVSAFAGWLYLENLKRAVEGFDTDKKIQSTMNLGSAIAAVGGGVNSGLMAFNTISPEKANRLYAKAPFADFLASKLATRLFGYGGAFLSFVTDSLKSKELFSEGDTDAGLFYAGSAVSIGIGGSVLTTGFTMTAGTLVLGLTPVGWIVLGFALVGASIVLAYSGETAKDTAIEKWLDANTFGKHDRPDAPTYSTLDEELTALGYAMHAPKVIDTDWEDRMGWPDYKAEASISLPGYDSTASHLRVRANGAHLGAYVEKDNVGGIAKLRHFLPKDGKAERVVFEVRYRPDSSFEKDYVLHVIVPEPSDYDEPSVSGP